MNNVIWSFAGPSGSGKTTLIRKISEKFPGKTRSFSEVIRENKDVKSIDEIRNDPEAYFNLQLTSIQKKIDQESEARIVKDGPKLVLIDRTLADSFFYYTTFVKPDKLGPSLAWQYSGFYSHIMNECKTRRYDLIVFMEPLPIRENDPLRPANLQALQQVERASIGSLCDLLFPHVPKIRIHAQRDVDLILDMAEEVIQRLTVSSG